MFLIALKLSIPKIGLNIILSSTVKKIEAFKFDGVEEFGSTGNGKEKNEFSISKLLGFYT